MENEILDSLIEGTFPQAEGTIEIIDVKPTLKSVPIPRGTVAYSVTKPDGSIFEGFNTLRGVKKMKEYHDKIGDVFTYDESRVDIAVPINFKTPFGQLGGCTKC